MTSMSPLTPLNVFIGYDSREPIAFSVLAHSITARAKRPVSITPLNRQALGGWYSRERGPTESTEFSLTRFLAPALCDYRGIAVFMDCDMLCRVDLNQVLYEFSHQPDAAVLVCQHQYTPSTEDKFLGQRQTAYPCKNWSSFMVFNNSRCGALTPAYINQAKGLELHRFGWLDDESQVGSLPLEWNWLVGEYPTNPHAKVFHYTLGGPWFAETVDCDHADLWLEEKAAMERCGSSMVVLT
jgi:hypothetical protein